MNADRRHTEPDLSARIDKSLGACWKEGVAAQIMIGILDYYLVPFALFLGASTQEIGFLVSVPHLLAAASQFFAVRAVKAAGSRRTLLLIGTGFQALLMLPLAAIAWIAMPGRIAALITIVAVFRILGSLIGPAWGSLVSDYLPENRRGQYFGWRSQVVGVSGVAGMILWGVLLSTLSGSSGALGFFVLFLLAGVFRAASFYFMSRMTDLPIHTQVDSDFSFWMFIRRFRESNFVKFVFYVSSITFATQLSAAYFSVYMLRDLKLDYMTYMTVHLASVLTGLIAFPLWGRHADMAGNAKILKINSVLIPIIPILWAFAQNPLHLVLVEIFAGFVWCGFNLCATNFIFDAVQPAKRVRCLGYFNLINGTATFLGASAGGFLAERLPAFRGSPLVTLFLVSGALRFAGDFFLARHFREVRVLDVKYRSAELVLSVLGIRPVSGRNVEMEVFPLFLLRPFIGRKKTRPPAAS